MWVTDFKFSPVFASQIESKVVAFQKYLTEQNNLLAVKVIANQTVVQAQATARSNVAKANGESQAIKVISAQLKQSPQYLQWLSINRWNGQLPYALGSGGLGSSDSNTSFGGFPFLQLPKLSSKQQSLAPTQQQTAQQNLTRH